MLTKGKLEGRRHEVAGTKMKGKAMCSYQYMVFAAVKHMAEYGTKAPKIKENHVMRDFFLGGLPAHEPPRTARGRRYMRRRTTVFKPYAFTTTRYKHTRWG